MSISHYFNRTLRDNFEIHDINPASELAITGNAEIGGTLRVDTVANDDTENRLLVLNTADNVLEYRDATTILNNPFDQDLNTFNIVEFDQVNINDNFLLSTFNDSFTRFHQTPAVTNNDKQFEFQSDTDTGAVRIDLNNSGNKSSGLKLQTNIASDGNAFIQYETGTNRWFEGVNKTNNEFAIHYSPGDPADNLYLSSNSQLTLTNTGNLTIPGGLSSSYIDNGQGNNILYYMNQPVGNINDVTFNSVTSTTSLNGVTVDINNGNTIISSTDDSTTTLTQTPASLVSGKVFNLVSDSNAQVQLSVTNNGATVTSHSMINLQSDATVATGNGGNQMIYYDTAGTGGWSVGKQRLTNTFRWNVSGTADFLVNDANTRMYLDSSGNLGIEGDMRIGSIGTNDLIISAPTDSLTTFFQTPAVTTGIKEFVFGSDTSDDMAGLQIYNTNAALTAHTGIYFRTDKIGCSGLGGNQFVHYETCGFGGWTSGHQQSTNTFRWNWMTVASDYLVNDANTRMKLTNTGDLTLTGQLYQKAEVVSLTSIAENTFVIDAITTKYVWTSTRGALSMASLGQANWTVTPSTGIAQLANYDDAVGTYYAMVNFSCSMKTTVGVDQDIEVTCRGAGTTSGFVPSAEWGAINQVINNTTDWHSVSFNSLLIISNTGWFEFTFANLSSSNNIQIKNARVTLIK